VALGVALIAVLSLVTVQRATPPAPAVDTDSAPTLPDRVYDVSPWLPVGMPGELVVAAQLTTRGTWTGEVPAIAVLTGSGRYLHLDAPDISETSNGGVAVAPDGRHLAYWATGTPSASPQTSGGQTVPVTGVVVVDVLTGDLRRHDVPTEHGISPEGLLWADDDTLLGGQSQPQVGDDGPRDRQGIYRTDPSWQWDVLGEGAPSDLPPGVEIDSFAEATDGQLLVRRRLIDLETGTERRTPLRSGTGSAGFDGANAYLRADGVLAELGGRGMADKVPTRVTIAAVTTDDTTQRVVPRTAGTYQVLGWRDDHLVVTRSRRTADLDQAFDMYAVDPTTGKGELVSRGGSQMLAWTWATDLLSAPVVEGIEPPSPMGPRVVAGLGAALLTGTVLGLVLWRRRVRP
jgi:hypothetical protein